MTDENSLRMLESSLRSISGVAPAHVFRNHDQLTVGARVRCVDIEAQTSTAVHSPHTNMRFSVLSLLLLTAVVGVAIATVQAAFDPNIGEVLYEIIRLTVVLLSAAALTIGIPSSYRSDCGKPPCVGIA